MCESSGTSAISSQKVIINRIAENTKNGNASKTTDDVVIKDVKRPIDNTKVLCYDA